jgi:ribonuclease HI
MIVSLYTDGSSHARGGKPGGWAWVLVIGDQVVAQGCGGDPDTTNNRMELMGAIAGLEFVQSKRDSWFKGMMVELVSDSQYTLGMANGAWKASSNTDLVERIRGLYDSVGVWRTRWVPGHTGDKYNEMCDKLAKGEKQLIVDALKAEKEQALTLDLKRGLAGDTLVQGVDNLVDGTDL